MKKYLVILGALLMVAGSVFAQGTILNQDSCDVSTSPAATLLLPYFSVSPDGSGETTLVTITNVSDTPAVAHFTVWTNLSYPVLDFNAFLTGYDVFSISLTDVLVHGDIPSTSTALIEGSRSLINETGNPWNEPVNWAGTCDAEQGGHIPAGLLGNVQDALMGGSYFTCDPGEVSLGTATMVGYITIDVVDRCSQDLPTSATANYFHDQMLFDNQLIGDYIRVDGDAGVSGANPLVHIKAVPFGGDNGPGYTPPATFPRTFYDRYQADDNLNAFAAIAWDDRRQPLPAQFAARYIEPGTLPFDTDFAIWRQGITNATNTDCVAVLDNLTPYVEIVRFDEHENPTTTTNPTCTISPCNNPEIPYLPETSIVNIADTDYIPEDSTTADPAGWLFMNMANSATDVVNNYGPTQAWVQIRMTSAGLFGVDYDAAYLANGCSNFQTITVTGRTGTPKIGPHHN